MTQETNVAEKVEVVEDHVDQIDDESFSAINSTDGESEQIDQSVPEPEPEPAEPPVEPEQPAVEPEPEPQPVEQPPVDELAAQHEKLAQEARDRLAQHFADPSQTQDDSFRIPSPDEDMAGFMKYLYAERMAQMQQMKEQQQQQQFTQNITNFYTQSMKAAEKKIPDINDAIEFLYQQRANEIKGLSHLYPEFATSQSVDYMIGEEYKNIVIACAQRGLDPANELYRIAHSKGYKKAQPVQQKPTITQLQRKQAGAKSLTSSGGKAGGESMDLDWIDSLSEEEMLEIANTDEKKYNQIKKVLAGR